MAAVNLISQAEYARRRGCDPTSVRDAIKAGRILLIDGKIDPDVADVQWQRNTRQKAPRMDDPVPQASRPLLAQRVSADSPEEDFQAARTRREVAEANLAEMREAELSGELIRAADVRAAYAKRAAGLRESLLQIPARLAAVMAAESDQARCHDILQDELHAVLAQITAEA